MHVIQALLGMLVFIGLGHCLRRWHWLSQDSVQELNQLCFRLFFPLKIALSFRAPNLIQQMSPLFLGYIFLLFSAHLFCNHLVLRFLVRDPKQRCVEENAAYRGNFIIMGFPLLQALYGPSSIALAGAMTGLSQFFYNFYSISLYEQVCSAQQSRRQVLLRILRSPLLIGVYAGLACLLFPFPQTGWERPLNQIADLASPVALLCMGYNLQSLPQRRHLASYLRVCFLKLLLYPLSALALAACLPLSPLQGSVAFILFGAPTAVNSFVLARKYGLYPELASQFVLLSTLLYLPLLGVYFLLSSALGLPYLPWP